MKKILLFSLGVSSLFLFSFVSQQDKGVKKIGENLYEVSKSAKFSDDDKAEIKGIIAKEYHIRDFKNTVMLKPIVGNKSLKWTALIDTKIGPDMLDKKAIVWEVNKKVTSEDESKLVEILKKYSK